MATVSKTPFAKRHAEWYKAPYNVPQMITALVLIEQSPAGKAWGVELAAIPSGACTDPIDRGTQKGVMFGLWSMSRRMSNGFLQDPK